MLLDSSFQDIFSIRYQATLNETFASITIFEVTFRVFDDNSFSRRFQKHYHSIALFKTFL